jgi:hypothetical protein
MATVLRGVRCYAHRTAAAIRKEYPYVNPVEVRDDSEIVCASTDAANLDQVRAYAKGYVDALRGVEG